MFILRKIEGGRINVFEPQILTVGATAVTSGQALYLSNGKLVKCTATTKPTFIALADGVAGADIPVGRVETNQLYDVPVVSGVVVGTKYQLDSTANGIATETSNGVAEVVAVGSDFVTVRFA